MPASASGLCSPLLRRVSHPQCARVLVLPIDLITCLGRVPKLCRPCVHKSTIPILLLSKRQAEKWSRNLDSLHPDAPRSLRSQDKKGTRQACRGHFRKRQRAEHCTVGPLQWIELILPREPKIICVSSESTLDTTIPPPTFTSYGNESPLLSTSVKFKGSKLTQHNTQHLRKIIRKYNLPSRNRDKGSPEFYAATNS